jgi:hypothetical protein
MEFSMRRIKTFVLHLYVDTQAPERLCGDVRALPDLKSFPFTSETGLLDLLHRLAGLQQLNDPQLDRPDHPSV